MGARHRTAGALIAALGAAPVVAQEAPGPAPALVELQIGGGPHQVLDALVRDSTMLLSLGAVLNLAEIRTDEVHPAASWRAVLEPDGLLLMVSTEGRFLRRGSHTWAVGPGDASWQGAELYVTPGLLRRLLSAAVDVNWADLVVVLRPAEALPVMRRLERERRASRLLSQAVGARAPVSLDDPTPLADGAVLDWGLISALDDPLHTAGLDLGLGMGLAGGGLRMAHVERATTAGRYATTRFAWQRAWSERRALRQVRLGHVTGTGPRPIGLLGAAVTNAPYLRPSDFGPLEIGGGAPGGWDLEIYHGPALVATERSDPTGGYTLPVPAQYGSNPIEVVAYGPHGEERAYRRTFLIPEDRLPAGRFEYQLSAGRCADLPCRLQLNADARLGALRALTLRAGTTYLRPDSAPGRWHPYLSVAGAPHASLNLVGEITAGASVGGRAWFVPTPDLSAVLDHTTFTAPMPDPLLGLGSVRSRSTAEIFWRPGRRDRAVSWRARGLLQTGAGLGTHEVQLDATIPFPRARLAAGVHYAEVRLGTGMPDRSAGAAVAVSLLLPRSAGALKDALVLGDIGLAADSGLTRAGLSLARQMSPALRLQMGASWRRSTGPRVALTISHALGGLRATWGTAYGTRTGMDGLEVVEGSVLWDPESRRVSLADGRSLDRGGVAGTVYRDENGNGQRDPGEPPVSGVRVRLGPQVAWTDADGRFTAWDLVPFEATTVEVDSLSLDNPLWKPGAPRFSVVPAPNTYRHVALPLVAVGEIAGRVTRGGRPVGGMRLRFQDAGGSQVEAVTFPDGEFYVFGVRPGRYRVLAGDTGDPGLEADVRPGAAPESRYLKVTLPER